MTDQVDMDCICINLFSFQLFTVDVVRVQAGTVDMVSLVRALILSATYPHLLLGWLGGPPPSALACWKGCRE
jgi:hypothetical protein